MNHWRPEQEEGEVGSPLGERFGYPRVHDAFRSPNKINLKKFSPRHIVIKQKIRDKDIIFKAAREKEA